MKCTISSNNIKSFSLSIQFLAKISDEIHFQPLADGLKLKAYSPAREAYAIIMFADVFFTQYLPNLACRPGESAECSVSVKPLLPIYKNTKNIESVILTLDTAQSRLHIKLRCKLRISRSYTIPALESDPLEDMDPPAAQPNRIVAGHKLLSEVVSSFYRSTREILLDLSPTAIHIKNHILAPEDDKQSPRYNYQLRTDEFETYSITNATTIAFSYHVFRALVHFADAAATDLSINFSTAGLPMHIATRHDDDIFVVNLLLSTLNEDATEPSILQPGPSVATKRQRSRRIASQEEDGEAAVAAAADEEDAPQQLFNFKRVSNLPSADEQRDEPSQAPSVASVASAAQPQTPQPVPEVAPRLSPLPSVSSRGFDEEMERNRTAPGFNRTESEVYRTDSESPSVIFETNSSRGRQERAVNRPERPQTPPEVQRKLRHIFSERCFEMTFDPRRVPGAEIVYAVDSAEEDNSC